LPWWLAKAMPAPTVAVTIPVVLSQTARGPPAMLVTVAAPVK